MKSLRQDKIIEIIQKYDVETQESLAAYLREEGIEATQATVSRDIKELRLQKILTGSGRYKYALQNRSLDPEVENRLKNIFRESVSSVVSAENIVVIKTLPGLASAACSAVDMMQIEYILGSLAGDDTGIIITRDVQSAEMLCKQLTLFGK
jgi:transcriptional regulator of arginine metabolism